MRRTRHPWTTTHIFFLEKRECVFNHVEASSNAANFTWHWKCCHLEILNLTVSGNVCLSPQKHNTAQIIKNNEQCWRRWWLKAPTYLTVNNITKTSFGWGAIQASNINHSYIWTITSFYTHQNTKAQIHTVTPTQETVREGYECH